MEEMEAERLLQKVEEEVSRGNYDLRGLGFWKLVAEAKKNSRFVEKFGKRISEVDQKVFRAKAWIALDLKVGHAMELVGTIIALILLYLGLRQGGTLWGIYLVVAAAILSATLHPFFHYIVGKSQGINFTFYFPDGPLLIEPTLKIDYYSYLRATPTQRAMMHVAGPIATSLAPLTVLILGVLLKAPTWANIVVLVLLAFNAGSEFAPWILIKLGIPKIFFADFRKTDTYRTLRELRA